MFFVMSLEKVELKKQDYQIYSTDFAERYRMTLEAVLVKFLSLNA